MFKRQKGVALVTGMLILVVASVIGVSSMSQTALQERIAGNQRLVTNAFMAAEHGLSVAKVQMDSDFFYKGGEGLLNKLSWNVVVGDCSSKHKKCRSITSTGRDNESGVVRVINAEYWLNSGSADAAPIVMLGKVETFTGARSDSFKVTGSKDSSGEIVGSAVQVNDYDALKMVLDDLIAKGRIDNYFGGFEFRDCDADDQAKLTALLADPKYAGITITCTPPVDDGEVASILSDPEKLEQFIAQVKETRESYLISDPTKVGSVPGAAIECVKLSDVDSCLGTIANPRITVWEKTQVCDKKGCSYPSLLLGANDSGAGVLIVEGDLQFSGTPSFSGIIIVTGETFKIGGGGKGGVVGGTIIFANPVQTDDTWAFGNATAEFNFDVDGGGTADFQYDQIAVDNAVDLLNKDAQDLWRLGEQNPDPNARERYMKNWKEVYSAT
ncbi:MAG: hypothetical protein PWP40_2272 [Rhodocyclaceae bacterium]|nr:hypothetical protein [Rhodocyclaceae bacterium]